MLKLPLKQSTKVGHHHRIWLGPRRLSDRLKSQRKRGFMRRSGSRPTISDWLENGIVCQRNNRKFKRAAVI